jgi:hypothetical protein
LASRQELTSGMAAYRGMAMTSQTSLASGIDRKYRIPVGQSNKYISVIDFLYTLIIVNLNSFISYLVYLEKV